MATTPKADPADVEDLLRDAFVSGRLYGITVFHRSDGYTASARWNGPMGWTQAVELHDPVLAIVRALTERPNRDAQGQITDRPAKASAPPPAPEPVDDFSDVL